MAITGAWTRLLSTFLIDYLYSLSPIDSYFELLFESIFSTASVSVALSQGLNSPIVGLSKVGLGKPDEFMVFSIAP